MVKKAYLILAAALLLLRTASAQTLERVSPESQGVSSEAILNFLDGIAESKNEFHSFVFLRHGKVIAEGWWNPYRKELKHTLYSTSKSFTSTAVGFAVSEGKLKLDDKVVSFFPDQLPDTVSPLLAKLTVQHLLMMSTGQKEEPSIDENSGKTWVQQFFADPISDEPGTVFRYNSIATYMLSAIVQKVTGQKIVDYLQPRLFSPLKITGADWEESPQKISTGGWGLRLKTEDLARFGQMMLQKGKWQGKTVVPANWVNEATTFKIKNAADTAVRAKANSDWAQGYCYQFWRCRHNAFRADGAFGQYILVMPDQDAVIAINSETGNMQDELNLVWKHLLPAMKEGALPANTSAQQNLQGRLASLAIKMPEKTTVAGPEKALSGKNFRVDANDYGITRIAFAFAPAACTFSLHIGDKLYAFKAGRNERVTGSTDFPFSPPSLTASRFGRPAGSGAQKTAGSFRWTDSNTLEIAMRYPESAHSETFICHFEGEKATVKKATSLQVMTQPGAPLPQITATRE
ncbi:MAG: serine hydrolase [Mucilaginibacter polytrichastri]|nr:serine hydrolase [Mucilaginibacter polytrichastri]